MKKLNVIAVLSSDLNKMLMCKRAKDPYKGLYNLVGGKVEEDEDSINAAYRELEEETGITKNDIELIPIMDFTYYKSDMLLEAYYGVLRHEVKLIEEVNKLEWISTNENFFDLKKYAGEGNIGHMLEQIRIDLVKK